MAKVVVELSSGRICELFGYDAERFLTAAAKGHGARVEYSGGVLVLGAVVHYQAFNG